MDLFHQTISMKSVGNLTDFVREHMLEASPVEERIQALIGHYQDLDRAHELVLKAKEQVGFLTPLVAACDEHGSLTAKVDLLRACREALRPWFASRKRSLLEKRIGNLNDEMESWPSGSQRRWKRAAANWPIATPYGRRSPSRAATGSSGSSAISPTNKARKRKGRGGRCNTTQRAKALELPGATDADAFAGQSARHSRRANRKRGQHRPTPRTR